LKTHPDLAYVARYESARHLAKAGEIDKARRSFKELYAQTLKQGFLPRIDTDMFHAFQRNAAGREEWVELFNEGASTLIAAKRRSAVITLAWQCHELGDVSLASQLFDRALAGVSEKERPVTSLAAIGYLWSTHQYARAEKLLQPILENKALAKYSSLWRLGAFFASSRGKTARSIEYMERALELEYEHLPKVINLREVRNDYAGLLAYYREIACANIVLEKELSKDFLARVVRAVDRWRSLDTDPTTACHSAAVIFKMAGARDLAWDYYTTPLSLRPNEAGAWLTLAQTMSQEGEYDLADRAYAEAFDAEPTNAQILWDRAMLLQQRGKNAEARAIFRQIARGSWQPRFEWLRTQAEWYANP
jgi:tetratricopeptide (TPR) repeat protein